MRHYMLYKGIYLNGNYVFSLLGYGLVIMNPQGKIVQELTRNTIDISSNIIYSMYPDSKGDVWLATDNGILRLALNSPFTVFTAQNGIDATPLSIERLPDGKLYVGTNNNLLEFDDKTSSFKIVDAVPRDQIFALLVDGNSLLVSSNGLYLIKEGKVILVQPSVSNNLKISALHILKKHPDILLASASFGMAIFQRDPASSKGWKFLGYVPGFKGESFSTEEDADGNVWNVTQDGVANRFTFVFDADGKINLSKTVVTTFDAAQQDKQSFSYVFSIGNTPYFTADSATYAYNKEKNRFEEATFEGIRNFGALQDPTGTLWIGRTRLGVNKTQYIIATPKPGGRYSLDSTALLPISEEAFSNVHRDSNGVVWIVSSDKLVRYNANMKANVDQSYKTLIRTITANKLSVDPGAGSADNLPKIKFDNNSLRFDYAAPFYEEHDKIMYQTWLEGFEKTWSAWGNNAYKEYTNLPPGKYKFHVHAINIYHKLSDEATYQFSILAPWYRMWWAYLLYAIAAALIIYAIVNWQVRKLRRQHAELEKIVADRTAELRQRAGELSVINTVQESLAKELDINSIYELIGNRICELFDTQTVIIRTFDSRSGNEEWRYAIERGKRLYSEPRPMIWANKELVKTKQPLLINHNYTQFAESLGGSGVSKGLPPKSAIFVPMMAGDSVRGSVSLQNVEKENAFTASDLRVITTLTNSMAVALENARLFDETTHLLADAKHRATELTTVNNVSKALATQLNPDDLIKLVGDQMRDLFKANIVYLALLNKKTNIISFPYQYGDNMQPIRLGTGLTSQIISSGEPLLINKDVEEKTGALGLQRVGLPAASYLGVPIPVGDEIIGVLSVQSTEQENRFNENDLRLLSTIASSAGVALRNAQLFEDVRHAKMEAELATKTAEKANEAKSAFLSTVSHELRTPLTSVLGFAKIIRKRLEDKIFPALGTSDPKTMKTAEQISENLNVVISEGERLTHLINDVLDLAKIEAGKMEWEQESVSLPEVIERAVAATTSLFEQKQIQLIKQVDTTVPNIIGDRDKLIQVVINLFSNAVKFTTEGSITCTLAHNDNEAIVSVADTGIGIAKEDFGAVFEQFKQVGGDTLTDKPKGTGLGLPICKEIIEHHGGRIWLESEVGKGSTFSFSLPFSPADGTGAETPIHLNELINRLKNQVVFSQLKTSGKDATILVVDDDDSIRSLLQQELSDAGYTIQEARDGKMALDSIRKSRPDLIILDVMMPEINGFDVAAILKNDPQTMDIPIIILSIVQDKARGFRIGVDRYLTKPIDTGKLFEEVGTLLDQGKSKKKVMVVDEDTSAVRSLTEVLQAKGYIVVESHEKDLLEKAISTQPDIIILNSVISDKNEIVQTLRFEKGLEHVLLLIYQ
ncbi:MAG TPA: GAF domain-containing protein [Chitinophagaceae bacterium]|nr:GAF domain-containing protein [Chitinophagaceae bacterium]